MELVFTIAGVVALAFAGIFVGGTIWGIGRSAGWGKSNKALKPAGKRTSLPHAYLDLDGDIARTDVEKIVAPYEDNEALGTYAQGIISTLDQAEARRKGIFSRLEQEFDKNSLTWDKYSAPVDVAVKGVLHNAAEEANLMAAFDASEYLRMDRIDRAGGYDDNSTEVARLKVMRESLASMSGLQKRNDSLLLELERLESELAKLTGSSNDTDQIIEEIQRLTEDAQYYA